MVQSGTAPEVFAKPANAWVAAFLGLGNLLPAVLTSRGAETSSGIFACQTDLPTGTQVTLLLRPPAEVVSSGETLTGTVADVIFRGQDFRVELENGMYFYLADAPQVGQILKLKIAKLELI